MKALGVGPIRILDTPPAKYVQRLHIVICPQMFSRLPSTYIAMQMEQTVSSRWLTADYIKRLEHAVAIMDYSLQNITYLQEQAGLSHQQIFYVPVSNVPRSALRSEGKAAQRPTSYDVAFYGDANTPRRQAFLEALQKHYSVLQVSEVFGESLYQQLEQARVIVNIHYYEGALLETTRIYECISLGHRVVSETSADIDEHERLLPYVTFTPVGDIEAMIKAVDQQLRNLLACRMEPLPADLAYFHFYFTRLMVALGLVDADRIDNLYSPLEPRNLSRGVGLSLPETPRRRAAFQACFPGYPVFPGLRHRQGWRGCALSYRYLARQALAHGLQTIEIREDDTYMDTAAEERWDKACRLFATRPDLDIICGLVADVADDVCVLEHLEHEGEHYIVIDRMTSMVCNRYGANAIQALAAWPFVDRDVERNTIDRYLEGLGLAILVPLPFIARHRADSHSTLWQFRNTTYDAMIDTSEKRLMRLAERPLTFEEGN